jgi:NitT/TauT family transport system substrate-binding protein
VGLIGQARGNGATVRSFAGWGRRTDLAVMVDKDSPLQKPADFRGHSIVVFAASPWAPFIDLWLRKGGMDRSTVDVMIVDPSALWGTYSARRADAVMSTPASALPVIDKTRPSRAILAESAGITYPSYGLVATEATLRSKADALKRLVSVQQHAWTHIRNGGIEDGVAAIIAERPDAKLDPAALREQIRLSLDFFDTPATAGKPLGWQAEADWTAGLNSLQEAGAVKPGWTVAEFYTNDFIA